MMRRKFEIVNGSTNGTVQPIKCELQISDDNNRLNLLIDGYIVSVIYLNGEMQVVSSHCTHQEGCQYAFNIDHLNKE